MPPIPPVTKALMLICTALFCLGFFVPLSLWFALWPRPVRPLHAWQVLSYAFLHSDMMHLFFNMLGLWMFGSELERLWGHKRYLHFLLAGVLAAAAAQLLITFSPARRCPPWAPRVRCSRCCWPSACCSPTAPSCRCSRRSR
jgi:membrane associated rhomboid family serine protease